MKSGGGGRKMTKVDLSVIKTRHSVDCRLSIGANDLTRCSSANDALECSPTVVGYNMSNKTNLFYVESEDTSGEIFSEVVHRNQERFVVPYREDVHVPNSLVDTS